jgi:hypothetical protein
MPVMVVSSAAPGAMRVQAVEPEAHLRALAHDKAEEAPVSIEVVDPTSPHVLGIATKNG